MVFCSYGSVVQESEIPTPSRYPTVSMEQTTSQSSLDKLKERQNEEKLALLQEQKKTMNELLLKFEVEQKEEQSNFDEFLTEMEEEFEVTDDISTFERGADQCQEGMRKLNVMSMKEYNEQM